MNFIKGFSIGMGIGMAISMMFQPRKKNFASRALKLVDSFLDTKG